jgi:ribonuclease HII
LSHSLHPRDWFHDQKDLINNFCKRNFNSEKLWLIGVDEVGAGCLAGPLVAAATIYSFDEHWVHEPTPHKIVDSKLLNIKQRLDAELWLKNQKSFDYHVQEISVERIDEINIYWARMEALSLCVLALIQKLNL